MRRFFYFRKRERLAVISLLLILLILLGYKYINPIITTPTSDSSDELFITALQEYKKNTENKNKPIEEIKQNTLSSFNPNRDSIERLISAGVSEKISRNIINYRNTGASFKIKSDLLKLYSITDSTYQILKPFIDLPESVKENTKANTKYPNPKASKAVRIKKSNKLTPGELVDLNLADSTLLVKVPQIGKYTALKILRYKERLGGFYSTSQLADLDLDTLYFKKWFIIENSNILTRNINELTFKELLRHPYLEYDQVKAIFNLKNQLGSIVSFDQLSLLDEFSTDDINRLKYYFSTQ